MSEKDERRLGKSAEQRKTRSGLGRHGKDGHGPTRNGRERPGAEWQARNKGETNLATTETADEVVDAAPIVIETAVVEYGETARGLQALAHRLKDRAYNLATVKGNDEARADRKLLVSTRTALEKRRLELNAADRASIAERIKLRDSEAERLTEIVLALETPIVEQIRADEARRLKLKQEAEAAEASRVSSIQGRIDQIRAMATDATDMPSSEILERGHTLKALLIDVAVFQEFEASAIAAKTQALTALGQMYAKAKAAEETAARLKEAEAELERNRVEAAARQKREDEERAAEQQRLAEINRVQQAQLAEEREKFAREQAEAAEKRRKEDAEATERQRVLDQEAADRRAAADREAQAQRAEADRVAKEEREAEAKRLAEQRAEAQKIIDEAAAKKRAEEEAAVAKKRKAEADAAEKLRKAEEAKTAATKRLHDNAPALLDLARQIAGRDLAAEPLQLDAARLVAAVDGK